MQEISERRSLEINQSDTSLCHGWDAWDFKHGGIQGWSALIHLFSISDPIYYCITNYAVDKQKRVEYFMCWCGDTSVTNITNKCANSSNKHHCTRTKTYVVLFHIQNYFTVSTHPKPWLWIAHESPWDIFCCFNFWPHPVPPDKCIHIFEVIFMSVGHRSWAVWMPYCQSRVHLLLFQNFLNPTLPVSFGWH